MENNILKKISKLIIDKRLIVFIAFAAACVYCAMSIGRVKVNDDITAFLPADTDTRRGLTVMEEEFVTYADAKVMLANTTYERAEAVAALRAVGRRGSLAQLHARRELYRVCSGKRRLGDICRDGADGVPVARHRRRRGCHSRRGNISAASAEEKTARPRGKRRAGRISKIPHMTMPLRIFIRRGNSFKC